MSASTHHRIKKDYFGPDVECSAPGCQARPEFECAYRSAKGIWRNHNYCRAHTREFAWKNQVQIPGQLLPPEAMFAAPSELSDEILQELLAKVQAELGRRGSEADKGQDSQVGAQQPRQPEPRSHQGDQDRFPFSFVGQGDKQTRPFVARLYPKEGKIEHFFFKGEDVVGEDGRITKTVEFETWPGSVLRRRYMQNGRVIKTTSIVLADGTEHTFSKDLLPEATALVMSYLLREIDPDSFLAQADAWCGVKMVPPRKPEDVAEFF